MSDPTARGPVSGEIMVAAVIFLFAAFVFVLFLYLRAKRYWGAIPPLRGARARLVFAPEGQAGVPRRGLDPALIEALPLMVFYAKDFGEGVECAVCLSELCDGEAARVLPECGHGFHSECIDMWLHSNSTCPLCRRLLAPEPLANANNTAADGGPSAVVFAEPREASSSSGEPSSEKLDRMLVIEIPRRAAEGFGPSNSETGSPISTRLRSLRRLLIPGNRGVVSPHSPTGADIEQGTAEASLSSSKTPTNS